MIPDIFTIVIGRKLKEVIKLNNNVSKSKVDNVKVIYDSSKKKITNNENYIICFLIMVIISIISSSSLIPVYIAPFVIIITPFLAIQIDKRIKEEY